MSGDIGREEWVAMVKKAAVKTGKKKTAYTIKAVDERIGSTKNRERMVRKLAGWLTHEEAEELREAVNVFNETEEEVKNHHQ